MKNCYIKAAPDGCCLYFFKKMLLGPEAVNRNTERVISLMCFMVGKGRLENFMDAEAQQ